MSRAHLLLASTLLVVAIPFAAQTQTPSDSVVADSVKPKKSRFGGLMNKAKQVAGNKAIQNAAKGAVTGVACTVVPGAAVVAAATGSGPCANAGLAGLLKGGGITGAATSLATGAASGAASKAVGKMTGAKGAAAAGALGAVGGQGGLSKAATAAAASVMLPRGGNAAAIAAAEANAAARAGNAEGFSAAQSKANAAGAAGLTRMSALMGGAGMAAGNKVEAVDFRELKALLPESLRGMKRTDATGQKQAAMGIQISNAEGRYASDDGKSVTLTITDMGSMTGVAGMATYAWASTEVDREGDGSYEKTTTFKGFKALEKYDRQSKSGELSVLIEGRFVVEADGSNVDIDAIKSALGSVDLRKLAGMKNKGVK